MAINDYYVSSGYPAFNANGDSASARAELTLINVGFDKLPALTGFGLRIVRVNALGTALESVTLTTAKILSSDGSVAATANIPLGGFKITGLAAGSANGDSVRYEQITSFQGQITTNANAITTNNNNAVHLTGVEAITGVKTLTKPLSTANATDPLGLTTKQQMDAADALAIPLTQKNASSGVESLMADGVTPTHGLRAVNGKAISLVADADLSIWDGAITSGLYNVNITVAQNGLPAKFWYLEILRHSGDSGSPSNQYRHLRASSLNVTPDAVYERWLMAGVWKGDWRRTDAGAPVNKGANIASATTLTLPADATLSDVTGTTTTTDFAVPTGVPTTAFGPWYLRATGVWSITHTVGQVEIAGGYSLNLAANDVVMVWQDSATLFRVMKMNGSSGGALVQLVEATPFTTTVTSLAITPYDNTIPQNTEGQQILTLIIPSPVVGNRIVVDVNVGDVSPVNVRASILALFKDSGVNAISSAVSMSGTTGSERTMHIHHSFIVASTTDITLNARIGGNVASVSLNTRMGGTAECTMTAMEVSP